ncbi:MAG: DUF4129 domain-containing protein [Chloroflexi bacterium]|nr:DUF4129 domain-containing protein [Chloroflexota bacterium]
MKTDWRQGLVYAALMGMVASWLFVIIGLLDTRAAAGRLSVPALLYFYPVAFAVAQGLKRLPWRKVAIYALLWLVWAIATLLAVKIQLFNGAALLDEQWVLAIPRALAKLGYGIRPELLLPLTSGVIWWLGGRLAYSHLSFARFVTEFQFGLVIMLAALLVMAVLAIPLAGTLAAVLVFFSLALLGAALAHANEGTSWLSGQHRRHWSGLLLTSLGIVLALGLLVSTVVTPSLLQIFLDGLKWVWGLIVKLVEYLASLIPPPAPAEPPPAMPGMPGGAPTEEFNFFTMPESVRNALRIAWTVLVMGFILFALWRVSAGIFAWLRRRLADMAGAEYEPLPGAFRADFLSLVKYLVGKLCGLRRLFSRTRTAELASARQVYRRLLRWAASHGYPRQVAQTPSEFFDRLAQLLPDVASDLKLITEHYSATRYGNARLGRYELAQMNESWHKVRRSQLKKRGTPGEETKIDDRRS